MTRSKEVQYIHFLSFRWLRASGIKTGSPTEPGPMIYIVEKWVLRETWCARSVQTLLRRGHYPPRILHHSVQVFPARYRPSHLHYPRNREKETRLRRALHLRFDRLQQRARSPEKQRNGV